MSGSPKTVNRLPAPVFLSSSPISRSAFIRTMSTGMRPIFRVGRDVGEALVGGLDGHAVVLGQSGDLRVEGEPEDAEQVDVLGADRLACRLS